MPRQIGDRVKCEVQFPMPTEFFDVINSIHDETFSLKVGKEQFECVLGQDGNPVKLNFPSASSSPPIVIMTLSVFCDLDDILTIKKSNNLTIII